MTDSLKQLEWFIWHRWREHSRQSGSMELTSSELEYLYALMSAQGPGLRLTELAALMQVSKASASTMARKLDRQGYLRREACPEDARASRLLPTDKALYLQKEETSVYRETATAMGRALSEEELAQLERLLAKACRALELPQAPLPVPDISPRKQD
ncbi:MarR family transcriptional regulator [Zobellella endophytica]|uniref:MarR family transcriptional regulator n=1 Tax=Zobellella endophytica TaxID=2116700 RepID=A0A2P7RDB5_9GAMM|nr:MarR family transcriptional regulator [Zobellella endophytica]